MPSCPKIILVDDDRDDAFLIERAFRKVNPSISFKHIGDGVEFLRVLDAGGQDKSALEGILLLDINMPRISGYDVLRRIKTSDLAHQLKVVVLTTSEAEGDRFKVLSLGADAFYSKPRSFVGLLDLVATILDR